jgi:TonB-dependent receptor
MILVNKALVGVATLALAQPVLAQAPAQSTETGTNPQAGTEVAGEDIVVRGFRSALKEAIDIERQATAVISVITADDAGQFPDQNVAESLQRVAGVTIERNEGEGRTIQVRGLNSNFNQVLINSAQIGSSDASGGRSVSLDIISSDLLNGITVAKTLLPETDHDSLGAQVNLLTLSAFDRKGMTGRLRAEGGLADYATKPSYRFGGDFTTLLDVGGEDTLGIAVAFSYARRNIQSEEVRGNTPRRRFVSTSGAISGTETPGSQAFLAPTIVDQRLKQNERERVGGTFQVDYRPDDDNQWSFTLIGAQLKDADVRTQNEWEVGQAGTLVAIGPGNARFNGTRLEQQLFFQNSTDRVFAANFSGRNAFDAWTLTYGGDYSKNRFTLPDALRGRFATGNTLNVDLTLAEDTADVSVLAGNLDPALRRFNQTLIIDERRTDEIFSGFLNLQHDFQIGDMPSSLKAGGRYRSRTKIIRRGERSINPTSGSNTPITVAAGLPVNLGGLPVRRPTNANFRGYFIHAEPDAARNLVEQTADLFALEASDVRRDFDFKEDTLAAYLQGEIAFSPAVSLVGGVRMEQTRFTASGLVVEVIERDGNDLPPVGGDAPQSFSRKSTEFFPSLHLRADVTDQVVARVSLSRAQVRPTFEDSRNFQEIATTQVTQGGQVVTLERTLDGGNPRLQPLLANQADVTLGWYPAEGTALTMAAFYKDLQNPFISTTFVGADVALANLAPLDPATGIGFSEADTVGNGGSGRLLGVELGLNHQFQGPLDGFFVSGNLTLIDGEARSEFVRNNEKLRLQDQASLIGNISVGFENERFNGRVAATYVGDKLESVDAVSPELDVIQRAFLTVDVSLRFNLTPRFQIYADVANLTGEVEARYFRGLDNARLPNRTSDFGRTFQLGTLITF